MKGFLIDENLPENLTFTPSLSVTHSAVLGVSVTDETLWMHAKANELVIVSKDADFSHRMMINEPPPWVVHLRFGNMRLNEYHRLLSRVWPAVEASLITHKLVCVYQDRIESFGSK